MSNKAIEDGIWAIKSALANLPNNVSVGPWEDALLGLEETLKKLESIEPVAHMYPDDLKEFETREMSAHAYSLEMVSPTQGETAPLYAAPQHRSPLTNEEIIRSAFGLTGAIEIARAIEAAHGIKD